jgi:hypothetical protein
MEFWWTSHQKKYVPGWAGVVNVTDLGAFGPVTTSVAPSDGAELSLPLKKLMLCGWVLLLL